MKDPEIKEKYKIWLMTPPKQRKIKTKAAFGRRYDVTPQTLNIWEKEPEETPKAEGEYDSINYLLQSLQSADEALLRSCLSGNAAAQKVLRQILGQLAEKDGGNGETGFSASDIARIDQQARRELKAEGYTVKGMEEVPSEQSLLPQEIWQDKGQD